MIIQNCNGKAIYVSLLFPKLGKKVKKIDIIAYPHKDDVHPSNPVPGDGTAYLNINIEDYLVKSSKAPPNIRLVYQESFSLVFLLFEWHSFNKRNTGLNAKNILFSFEFLFFIL